MKRRALTELDNIINPANIDQNSQALAELDEFFLLQLTPQVFHNSKDNIQVLSLRNFENMSLILEEMGFTDIKNNTVFEYVSKIIFLETKYKNGKSNSVSRTFSQE